jgi:hypothetical protein
VRVLRDENIPHDLIPKLSGHEVLTVQSSGWAGAENGELLRLASGQVNAFITMDRRLTEHHETTTLSFGIIVIRARSNRIQDLEPLVPGIRSALGRPGPGQVEWVGSV